MPNIIIPYNPKLKPFARKLRKRGTLAEVVLWQYIRKKKILGYEFHRQVPIDNFIVDFYCHELKLAIEVDGISHDDKFKYDQMRQKRLEKLGVNLIRFVDEDVKNETESVLKVLKIRINELGKGK